MKNNTQTPYSRRKTRGQYRRRIKSETLMLYLAMMGALVPLQSSVANTWRIDNYSADSEVLLVDVHPGKLFYPPGESMTGLVKLTNRTAEARPVQLRIWLEQEIHRQSGLQTRDITVAANHTQEEVFTWPGEAIVPFGQALVVEVLVDGHVTAVGRDYFSSADNLWKVAIGALPAGPASSSANYTEDQIIGQVQRFRDQYCNVWEKYFWAPDDWGQLTTAPGATWFSGQARRHEHTEKLKLHVQASHAQGIAVVTYGKCMAGGPAGWEMARARPQWFLTDVHGRTMGRPADVWDLDHWQQADQYEWTDFKYAWTYRWVDLRRVDALDHGIDQLIASTKQFGWDGVRFDSGGFRAHFVDGRFNGNDIVNTRNMKRTKERLWDIYPNYLFGYNTDNSTSRDGRAYPLTIDEMSREMREMLAGGGLWMGEGIKHFANGGVTYGTWSQFARDERRCIQAVREAGGHFCYLFHHSTPVRDLYQFVIALIIGAHPYGGEHVGLLGSVNWGAFMTRWSGLLWDPMLRPLDAVQAGISVTANAPLWWLEFINERIVAPDRRQVIVHLLNPPVDDDISKVLKAIPEDLLEMVRKQDKPQGADTEDDALDDLLQGIPDRDRARDASSALLDDLGWDDTLFRLRPQLPEAVLANARAQQFPAPVVGSVITITVPVDQTPRHVWIITPDSLDHTTVAAEWKVENHRVLITAPKVDIWSMVVCEFEGEFTKPSAPAPFSAALTAAENAELKRLEPAQTGDKTPWFGLRPPAPTPNIPPAPEEPVPEAVAVAPMPAPTAATTAETVPPGLAVGGNQGLDILVVNGLYHAFHRVPQALQTAAPEARLTVRTTRDLPTTHEEFFAYDLIVLVNLPASAWAVEGQQRLAAYVKAGGRLAILGGPFTLGQGAFAGSPLEHLLPIRLEAGPDIVALPSPLPLGPLQNAAFADQPSLYYLHTATPTAGATIHVWAGDWPVLVEGAAGQGTVLVLLAAPLGEAHGNDIPFWEAESWPATLGRALPFGEVDSQFRRE